MEKSTFEVHIDELGKFRFRVRNTKNKIVSIGDGCETRTACINGIADIKKSSKDYFNSEIRDFTNGETTLILNKPKHRVKKGSIITFSGRLYGNANGEGLENSKITIYESDGVFLKEIALASGYTTLLGKFNIDWVAKKMDWWDNSIEVYAKFEGEDTLKMSSSRKQVLFIS
jgi:uncharacterized protein YegP (UPF0339 family)